MNLITVDLLVANGACQGQLELFKRTFPNGAKLNKRNLAKAVKAGLGVNWLGRLLFMNLWSQYQDIQEFALRELEVEHHLAYREYQAAQQLAVLEGKILDPSVLRRYQAANEFAQKRYQTTCGLALLEMLKQV